MFIVNTIVQRFSHHHGPHIFIDVAFLAAASASTIDHSHDAQPDDDDHVHRVRVHAPCLLWPFVCRENHSSGATKQ